MNVSNLRLKIELKSDLDSLDSIRFWYYIDLSIIKTIDELRKDILEKYFSHDKRQLKDVALAKLSVDNFDLPLFESTRLLRESDLVEIHLLSRKSFDLIKATSNLKRKLSDDSIATKQPLNKKANLAGAYEACLIGSSMIKHINSKEIFPNQKCYFNSISGGKIKDILASLKSNEQLLKNASCFVVTCGSNDCDSLNDMKTVINDYLDLAQYLHSTHKDSKFIFNKLIPRSKCRYVSLIEFEKRRVCFNEFLEITLPLIVPCKIVDHKSFENKTHLNDLLTDGVHISPVRGLPLYVEQIKKALYNS